MEDVIRFLPRCTKFPIDEIGSLVCTALARIKIIKVKHLWAKDKETMDLGWLCKGPKVFQIKSRL